MSLKHTLATAALATTLSSCGMLNTFPNNEQTDFNEPYNVLNVDTHKRQKTQDKYKQKYCQQMKNISGAWFSFGDEKHLRQVFYEMAHTPHGQNIIANLPDKLPIETSRFLEKHQDGVFSTTEMNVRLRSGKFDTTLTTLYHELLHAVQFNLGEFDTRGYSIEQVVSSILLAEAETKGWDHIHNMMERQFGTLHPSGEAINEFMKKDLIAIAKKAEGKDFDEICFKETDRDYSFQQSLKKYKGNLYEAQKEEVGKDIVYYMNLSTSFEFNSEQRWKEHYTNQGIQFALTAMYEGKLTAEGNAEHYQRHINRLVKQYHVHPDDVDCLVISAMANQALDNLHDVGLKGGYDIGQYNKQNKWQNCMRLSKEQLQNNVQDYQQMHQSFLNKYYRHTR